MSQFRLLFSNAWVRFARADGLARAADPRGALLLAAIALGAPGMVLAFLFAVPVFVAGGRTPIDLWPFMNLLALYSGLLVALAMLLQWDSLLPNAADVAALAPLPVAPRRLVAAQGAALATLLALLTCVVNAPAVILIPLLDTPPRAHLGFVLGMALRQIAGVTVTACLAFGSLLALQSLIICCTGLRGLRTVGAAVQLTGLVVVLAALLLAPGLFEPGLAWRPLLSSPLRLAGRAAGAVIAACALYVLAARRALRPSPAPRAHRAASRGLWGWGRSPKIAAVSRFAALTLLRCPRQRLVVGIWLAVGAAAVIAGITGAAMAAPLVLSIFFLIGLRHSFAVPVDLQANWVFRLNADGSSDDWVEGGRHLMCLCQAVLLVPVAVFAVCLWPAPTALGQIAFLAVVGAISIQCLTWRLRKLPFTCSYRPGDLNLKYRWPFYVAGFAIGGRALSAAEQWLLPARGRSVAALAVLAGFIAWSECLRRRSRTALECIFEDEPEPLIQSLLPD